MDDCLFWAIVTGRAPAHRLVEDEHTVSFLNVAPGRPAASRSWAGSPGGGA
jgi:histidine triad (HIT) family protein